MTRAELRSWRGSRAVEAFDRSVGAAASGLLTRVVAALMRLSLLLRGRVPGGHAAAAFEPARTSPHAGICHHYARVTGDGGYVVLSYWFFHPVNDWRSTLVPGHRRPSRRERAPAGPEYERDGSPRASWARADLDDTRAQLREATVADRAAGSDALPGSTERDVLKSRVAALRRQIATVETEIDRLEQSVGQPTPVPGPQDHLRHRALPMAADKVAQPKSVRAWASASTAVWFTAPGLLLFTGGSGLLLLAAAYMALQATADALLHRSGHHTGRPEGTS